MIRQIGFNLATAIAALGTSAALAATITVNSVGDATANDGQCTLREAITATSTNTASGASAGECAAGDPLPTVDTIAFAIAGTGVRTIQPLTVLPDILEAVVIDGYTQTGAHANTLAIGDDAILLIEIDGSLMAAGNLLRLSSSGSTIRGLVINRIQGTNIYIGSAAPGNENHIEGNFLNTDPSGTQILGGQFAVVLVTGAQNVIGGTTPSARNVIPASAGLGGATLMIGGDANVVQGNYIGVDASGTVPVQFDTSVFGIALGPQGPVSNTLIGGDVPGAGNVIVANATAISLGPGGTGTTIQGNFIGTDATSTIGLGGSVGIATNNAPTDTHIGGATAGAGNVFASLNQPIHLGDGASGVVIQGNHFGTDTSGAIPVPNHGSAIVLDTPGGNGSIIGGTNQGEGNSIAYSCGQGIAFTFGRNHWPILGNSIHSNVGLGISLQGGSTPLPNDTGDGDDGSNDQQNYPVITATVAAGTATISGTLNSTPDTTFRLEFFASEICDASGFGEGQAYIGTTDVTTDSGGDVSFGPLSFPVPDGAEITATATDPAGNTSEFSQCSGPHDHIFVDGFEALPCG